MRSRWRHLVSIMAAVLLLGAMAGSVSASGPGLYDSGSWDNPIDDHNVCDKYDISGHDYGHWQIENSTKALNYQFFYFTNWYNGHTTVTNPANGKSVTEDWHGIFKEVHAKPHKDDGNVFTYETVEAGLYTITKSNHKVAYADPYLVVTRRDFDTLGDSQPGGQQLSYEELTNTVDQTFDFCVFLDSKIG